MERTFIVSGYMRCGTSMMMQALKAGGLTPSFNDMRNRMNKQFGDKDYLPNGKGFYELSRKQYSEPDFPNAHQGKLIKCLYGGITKIQAGNYCIVYMMRDFEEIRQSYEAFFGTAPGLNEQEHKVTMATTIGILRQRLDINLTVLNYRDVIENPVQELQKLEHWEINVAEAAKVVDPELLRFKIEDLEVGI